jgi:hypothetical protein
LPTNSTQWQDKLAQNGHGLLFPDFTITARKYPGKKGYPQFQRDCRSVEYKTVAGNLLTIGNQSTLPTKKELDD